MIYINFTNRGLIESWNENEIPHQLVLENFPKDFKGNEDHFESETENAVIVGIKKRSAEVIEQLEIDKANKQKLITFEP